MKRDNNLYCRAWYDQDNPKGFYVYAHCDIEGRVFYVGKGTGRRAWSKDRHDVWVRYVEKHLGNQYEVRILADNLTSDTAEDLEADFIAQCGDTLVNWANFSRSFDYQAIDQYHKLRNANRKLMQKARKLGKSNPKAAAKLYVKAIEATKAYAFMNLEKGLVGQLLQEEKEELGRAGEIEALNRLTMCLIKLQKVQEAAERAVSYFSLYRLDLSGTVSESITKSIEKAFARAQKYDDRNKFYEMLNEMKKTSVKPRTDQLADMLQFRTSVTL